LGQPTQSPTASPTPSPTPSPTLKPSTMSGPTVQPTYLSTAAAKEKGTEGLPKPSSPSVGGANDLLALGVGLAIGLLFCLVISVFVIYRRRLLLKPLAERQEQQQKQYSQSSQQQQLPGTAIPTPGKSTLNESRIKRTQPATLYPAESVLEL
jgi:predicted lipid-binding transport protein (Tim44 family)